MRISTPVTYRGGVSKGVQPLVSSRDPHVDPPHGYPIYRGGGVLEVRDVRDEICIDDLK